MLDKDALLKTDQYKQPYQKEKDYIEELFLTEIYASPCGFVFKGGTAISKFYGSMRFSDDLDFSVLDGNGIVHGQIGNVVAKISECMPVKILRERNDADMTVYELSLRGPLYEIYSKYQHLNIEIDKKASTIEKPNTFRRNPIYQDLRPYIAIVMSSKEILSEKVVALLFRHNLKARDLYDLYFLIQEDTEIDVSLIDRKMREYGHAFTYERFDGRMKEMGRIWDAELKRLLPEDNFLEYGKAEGLVRSRFKASGLI